MIHDNFRIISEPVKPSKSSRFKFYKIIKHCKVCNVKIFVQYKVGGFSYNKTTCDTCQKAIRMSYKPQIRAKARLKKKNSLMSKRLKLCLNSKGILNKEG